MPALLDTHQHLIYPDRLAYAWTAGVPALKDRAFTLADYRALAAEQGIGGTIFMEVDCADRVAEAELVAGLMAAREGGILGQVASCRPETDAGFVAWLERGPSLGVVGYRRILHEVPDEVSRSETFRANLRRIGARGLPFDMVFLARQLPIALELARACPETVLVLDHCGVPDVAGHGLDPWRARIAALAGLPNVVAKISGILAYCAPGRADAAAVAPYLEHVIACFGPDRCLWGSDWPVVNARADLARWVETTRAVLSGLSPDEAAAIAHRTAERVYGVALPLP